VAVGAVVAFWVGTLAAGALAPGYSVRDDYVSSLAGRGSSVAALGIAAIALLGGAHLAAAAAARSSRRSSLPAQASGPTSGPGRAALPVALALAGVAGLMVAAFRTACPLGAAGCGFGANDAPPDLADLVHGQAVLGYEAALVLSMLLVVPGRGARWFRLLTALAAAASVVLLLQTGGAGNGAWQRAWLVVNTAWLVALVLTGTRHDPAADGPPRRAGPARR